MSKLQSKERLEVLSNVGFLNECLANQVLFLVSDQSDDVSIYVRYQ